MTMKHAFSRDELALLEAIHADPRNDAPRLVYADWLDKNGHPEYAEFIRLQCVKPYIGVANRDPSNPHVSHSWEFPWEDETAKPRRNRMLELLPKVYSSERFAESAKLPYYEEFYRGLSILHIEEIDCGRKFPPLCRFDLTLNTAQLADWLVKPLMMRVDKLHIWPDLPFDAEPDANATMNSHYGPSQKFCNMVLTQLA
jgi:uncharacterized protein (TIGR02996 family)